MWWSFRNKPIVLLTLLNILFRCSWKSSLVSKNITKCFWVSDWITMLLLKINEGWDDFWILRDKRTSSACFFGSGIKLIFHWNAQLFILPKSSFKFFADKSLSNITEKRDVSSANSLGYETKFSDKSFYILKKVAFWKLNLEEPLIKHWPIMNFDHLKLIFAFYLLKSLPKYLVSYPLSHFVVTYK